MYLMKEESDLLKVSWHRCREQTYGHQGGKVCGGGMGGGGGGMNWEIGIDIYTSICIKLITNNLLYKKIKFKKKSELVW